MFDNVATQLLWDLGDHAVCQSFMWWMLTSLIRFLIQRVTKLNQLSIAIRMYKIIGYKHTYVSIHIAMYINVHSYILNFLLSQNSYL